MTKKLDETIARFEDRADRQEENQKKVEGEVETLKKELNTIKTDFLNYKHEMTVSSKIT